MIAATLFKIVNLACHLMVPTPNFCRSKEGENDLIKIVYKKDSKENRKDMDAEKVSLQKDAEGEKEQKNIHDEKCSLNEDTNQACDTSLESINTKKQEKPEMSAMTS